MLTLDFSRPVSVLNTHTNDEAFQAALELCKQWLIGKQYFTFRTSGSTGTPKTIRISRKRMEWSAAATNRFLDIKRSDHFLCCLPVTSIGGAMVLIRAIQARASCTIIKPNLHPLNFITARHTYTITSFTPAMVADMNEKKHAQKLKRFRHILLGGAPLSTSLEMHLAQIANNMYHTYGMTETVSHIAIRKLMLQPYFQVLDGVKIKTNSDGCLCIKSPSTSNRWLQTNDMAVISAYNQFQITGRKDFVINSGGIKVQPEIVEKAILELLPQTAGCVVVGLPHAQLGSSVAAVVSGVSLTASLTRQWDKKLKRILPAYFAPRQWINISKIPLTHTGKPDRIALVNALTNS